MKKVVWLVKCLYGSGDSDWSDDYYPSKKAAIKATEHWGAKQVVVYKYVRLDND